MITVTEVKQLDGTGDYRYDVEYSKATSFAIDSNGDLWINKESEPRPMTLVPAGMNYTEQVYSSVLAYYAKGSFVKVTQTK